MGPLRGRYLIGGMATAGLLTAACGPPPHAPVTAPVTALPSAADGCALLPDQTSQVDTLRIGLDRPVTPARAPLATNGDERLVFGQLYETLLWVDCAGHLRPGLAASWSSEDNGRSWSLTLRPDARFWDGTPVTAAAIIGGWTALDDSQLVREAGVESVTALGDRTVGVTLTAPSPAGPLVLGDPRFAVSRLGGHAWPQGTGAYRVDSLSSAPGLIARSLADTGGEPRVLLFRPAPRGDARESLDAGADLVVTDDPAVGDYAQSRPDLSVLPLPWDRTYVLLAQPPGSGTTPTSLQSMADPAFHAALARDAVRGEARGAEPPFWWDSLGCASRAAPGADGAHPAPYIAYPRGDRTARELAARLVALGTLGTGVTAMGLPESEWGRDLASGRYLAYVLAVPRHPLAPCFLASAWPDGASAVPLVDTRSLAILRRGAPSPVVDWAGALRFP